MKVATINNRLSNADKKRMSSKTFIARKEEEQDLNAEWYTKVATTLQKAIQCYHIIYDKKNKSKSYYPHISGLLFQRVDRIESRIEGTRTCAINVRRE